MLKLMRYMKGSILLALAAPLFMVVEVIMDLMQPTLMAQIIDIGVANGDVDFIWNTGLRMTLYAVIGVLGGLGCIVTSSYAAVGFGSRLRQGLYEKIQTLSFAELDRLTTGSLITRLTNDVTQIQNMVMMSLRIMVRAPLMSLGGIIMAFRLAPSLSMILLVAIPLMLIGAGLIFKATMPLFMVMQTKLDRVNTVMRENLLGIKVIKAFVTQAHERLRFGKTNQDLRDSAMKAMKNIVLMFPMVLLVMNLSVVAVLWFGGRMHMAGQLEIGKIMAFINYLIQIMSSVMMLVMISMNYSRAKVAVERIQEVFLTPPSIEDPQTTGGLIEQPQGYEVVFDQVYYRHHNSGECVLKDISFKLPEGQVMGIVGSTGSGKSTLVSMIPRLYNVTRGRVLLGGVDVRHIPLTLLREKVGMVLQDSVLFAQSIEENLRLGNQRLQPEELREAARQAQALEFIEEKAEGFQMKIEQRGRNLSGGQKQRLSIARTLLRRPEILILDDSTSAVDLITESKIREAILAQKGQGSVIVIAQRVASIRDADQILVLDEGHIQALGSHRELLQSSEIYRHLAVSQLGEEVLEDVNA